MIHQLTFSPVGPPQPGQHVHLIDSTLPAIVDMQCPECGEKLFVYYRTSSEGGDAQEQQTEGEPK